MNQADENAKNAGSAPNEGDTPDTDLEEVLQSEGVPPETAKTAALAAAPKPDGKSGEKKDKKAQPEKKKDSLFAEVKGEFKKIVWPPRRELVKQTTTVVMVALMFGVIIFLMDSVFGFGINSFIGLMVG